MNAKSSPWPADKVERRKLSRLNPYERNPRLHSSAQVDQIVASIKQWGWTIPVLVDEKGVIIAGHGRVLAAKRLGLTDVPVMVARGWTEAQKNAYRIADNQLTLTSEWDMAVLSTELRALKIEMFEMPLIGFPEMKLVQFFAEAPDDAKLAEINAARLAGVKYAVIIECESEDEQRQRLQQFAAMGLKVRALML